jgi:DNA processing protein
VVDLAHITPRSPSWPAELCWIDAAPKELWLRGRLDVLARRPRVALVGTRSPTPYGLAQARRFGRELASAGAAIVSGLARGIDSAAHLGALEADGATLAVLGSGVDLPWPDTPLVQAIESSGLLLSEFPPGFGPRRDHFPRRNRIISGLCKAVVVIEASAASGSLITARWAVDQGRDVYALPGRVDHPMARGCHHLIREGAGLIEEPSELLSALDLAPAAGGAGLSLPTAPTEPLQVKVLAALRGETLFADELADRVSVEVPEVLTALVGLELSGWVVRSPGGLFSRS